MIWTKVKDRMPAIGELIVFDSIFVDRLTVFEVSGTELFYKDRRKFIQMESSARYLVIPKPITEYSSTGQRL